MSDEKRAKDEKKTGKATPEPKPTAVEPGPADDKGPNRSYMGTAAGRAAKPREGGRSYGG